MGLFNNYDKVGPGVSKNAPEKHRFFLFFELFGRKFTKLIVLNLLYFVTLIPLFLGLKLSLQFNSAIAGDVSLVTKQPIIYFSGDIIGILFMIIAGFITGPATAGFTYVIRNFQREEHAWVASDFFEQFKKNFKQGAVMSFIDIFVCFLMYVAFVFYSFQAVVVNEAISKMSPFFTVLIILISIIYMWMHYYIYVMMVTFDLKLKDILRNAALFAFAKLPLNIFISAVIAVLGFFAILYYVIGIAVFVIIGFSLLGYIITFCVYPTIDKLMIKPQKSTDNDEDKKSDFNDDLQI